MTDVILRFCKSQKFEIGGTRKAARRGGNDLMEIRSVARDVGGMQDATGEPALAFSVSRL